MVPQAQGALADARREGEGIHERPGSPSSWRHSPLIVTEGGNAGRWLVGWKGALQCKVAQKYV